MPFPFCKMTNAQVAVAGRSARSGASYVKAIILLWLSKKMSHEIGKIAWRCRDNGISSGPPDGQQSMLEIFRGISGSNNY